MAVDLQDSKTISAQIGRPARGEVSVASRCDLGLPVVIKVPPLLGDGTPFPTLYWLTCPLASRRVARIESAGEFSLSRKEPSPIKDSLIASERRTSNTNPREQNCSARLERQSPMKPTKRARPRQAESPGS